MTDSKELSEAGMINLLDNDVEQVGTLRAFADALLAMYSTNVELMSSLRDRLDEL